MSKRLSSTYSDENRARIDKVLKSGETASQLQNAATMAEVKRREAVVTPPPPPPPTKPETWADRMGVNAGPTPSPLAIAKVVSLGLRWIQISPERGWFTTAQQKVFIDDCHKAGLLVKVVLQEGGHDYALVAKDTSPFAAWAAGWVDLGVDALGILNESNNIPFYKPTPEPMARVVARITIACFKEIRAKSKTVPIHTVGWSPNGGILAPAACQKDLIAELKKQGFDPALLSGADHHGYEYHGPLNWGMPQNKAWNSFQQIPDVYLQAAAGGCKGGMSIGEYGCPSAGTEDAWPFTTFTEEKQATVIGEYFTGLAAFRKSGVPISYLGLSTAVDGEASTRLLETTMGVFRRDGSEKPSAAVVRAQGKLAWAV